MRVALGVDLGGTALRTAFVAEDGTVLAARDTATDAGGGPAAVIGQIIALVQALRADRPELSPEGLGIGAPGPLDPKAGIALAPPTLAGWRDVPLGALLAERLGLAVAVENDANAAALGEWRFGAGRGTASMVFVTVSTGIGGGVIAEGRLLHGHRGLAAEIGHMRISETSEEACFCGQHGCWEALASATALGRRAARAWGDASMTSRDLVAAARSGETRAFALLGEEADYLATGFVNLLHLFSPERIVMGGGLGAALDLMQANITAALRSRAMPAYREVPVVAAGLGARAGLVGAASLILAGRA